MMQIQKSNFYLFTGGPGAGKTAVIDQLSQQNQLVVPENARTIIRHQKARGDNATHDGERVSYKTHMLERSIENFKIVVAVDAVVYFDRELLDLYSYTRGYSGGVTRS